MAECDRLAIAERERAAFLDERNRVRAENERLRQENKQLKESTLKAHQKNDGELAAVRERMNALAAHCEKLEKNQLPADAVCFVPTGEERPPRYGEYFCDKNGVVNFATCDYQKIDFPIYRRVEAKGAEADKSAVEGLLKCLESSRLLGERTEECISLRQEVERLKAESKANQEAADVLRLIEAGRFTLRRCAGNWGACNDDCDFEGTTISSAVKWFCKERGITLPAKDDAEKRVVKESLATDAPSPAVAGEGEKAFEAMLTDKAMKAEWIQSRQGTYIPTEWNGIAFGGDSQGRFMTFAKFHPEFSREREDCAAYLNGTSAVHRQLAEARKEIDRLKEQLPQWEHDCDCSVFLGRHGEQDLYWCWQDGDPTLIVRYSSYGPNYDSAPKRVIDNYPQQFAQHREAMRRAAAKHLPL